MTHGQYKDRPPKIIKRLTRDEAVAYLLEVLMGRDVPFQPGNYAGGPSQIISDAVCISPETIKNYAARGRKTLEKSYTSK